ncbi:hypothetical protein BC833DRAFT_618811 [Globomyces pollinis-pini]|nr:hypothetical protein BC833DRAFT_618811 [Globomyces pollinis-pini]
MGFFDSIGSAFDTIGDAFSKDGAVTKVCARIPVVGHGVSVIHMIAGNEEEARRDAINATMGIGGLVVDALYDDEVHKASDSIKELLSAINSTEIDSSDGGMEYPYWCSGQNTGVLDKRNANFLDWSGKKIDVSKEKFQLKDLLFADDSCKIMLDASLPITDTVNQMKSDLETIANSHNWRILDLLKIKIQTAAKLTDQSAHFQEKLKSSLTAEAARLMKERSECTKKLNEFQYELGKISNKLPVLEKKKRASSRDFSNHKNSFSQCKQRICRSESYSAWKLMGEDVNQCLIDCKRSFEEMKTHASNARKASRDLHDAILEVAAAKQSILVLEGYSKSLEFQEKLLQNDLGSCKNAITLCMTIKSCVHLLITEVGDCLAMIGDDEVLLELWEALGSKIKQEVDILEGHITKLNRTAVNQIKCYSCEVTIKGCPVISSSNDSVYCVGCAERCTNSLQEHVTIAFQDFSIPWKVPELDKSAYLWISSLSKVPAQYKIAQFYGEPVVKVFDKSKNRMVVGRKKGNLVYPSSRSYLGSQFYEHLVISEDFALEFTKPGWYPKYVTPKIDDQSYLALKNGDNIMMGVLKPISGSKDCNESIIGDMEQLKVVKKKTKKSKKT